jgi:fumarate reductase subunit C
MILLEIQWAISAMGVITFSIGLQRTLQTMQKEKEAKDPDWKYNIAGIIFNLVGLFAMLINTIHTTVEIGEKLLEGLK